jgi:hypothetical protein
LYLAPTGNTLSKEWRILIGFLLLYTLTIDALRGKSARIGLGSTSVAISVGLRYVSLAQRSVLAADDIECETLSQFT